MNTGNVMRLSYCVRLRRFLVLLLAGLTTSLMAQPGIPVLTVYTEVRNNNELRSDPSGNSVVDNPASRLLDAMLTEANLQYDLHVYPWARIRQGLDNERNLLAYPVTRTASREQRWLWVGEIQPLSYYLYGSRERLDELPRSLEAAREFRVGTVQGDVIDTYLEANNFTALVRMTDVSRAPLMLERGRFDLFAMGAHRISEYTDLYGIDAQSLVPVVALTEISTALYFTMSRDTDPALLEQLRAAYQRIVANGTYARIMSPGSYQP